MEQQCERGGFGLTSVEIAAKMINGDKVSALELEVREALGEHSNAEAYALGKLLLISICEAMVTRAALGAYRWNGVHRRIVTVTT
jgi:hypothetical protein